MANEKSKKKATKRVDKAVRKAVKKGVMAIMHSPSSVFSSENEWTLTRCLLPMCGGIHTSTLLPDGEPVQWLVFARSSASRLFWKAGSSSDE